MLTHFDSKLQDSNGSEIVELSRKNQPLLIAFAGITGKIGIQPFEFFNQTRDLDINKIYLRDLSQLWYQSGLSGLSENIAETVALLRRRVDESGANKVVVFGNSMGGYAAILFGLLIKADVVHAFSPQTSLVDAGNIRSKRQIKNVHDRFDNEYFDLNDVFELQGGGPGEFNIYYNSKNTIDEKHAMHLKRARNLTLHAYNGGGHGLIRDLRESGELRNIIVSAFQGCRPAEADDATIQKRYVVQQYFRRLFRRSLTG